MRQPLA
jgi:hypothetical protein